jgi:hypothetical protein
MDAEHLVFPEKHVYPERYLVRVAFGLHGAPSRYKYRFVDQPDEANSFGFEVWKAKRHFRVDMREVRVFKSRMVLTSRQARRRAEETRIQLPLDEVWE